MAGAGIWELTSSTRRSKQRVNWKTSSVQSLTPVTYFFQQGQLAPTRDQVSKYQVTSLHFYIILFSYYKPGRQQHAITIHTTPGCYAVLHCSPRKSAQNLNSATLTISSHGQSRAWAPSSPSPGFPPRLHKHSLYCQPFPCGAALPQFLQNNLLSFV